MNRATNTTHKYFIRIIAVVLLLLVLILGFTAYELKVSGSEYTQ